MILILFIDILKHKTYLETLRKRLALRPQRINLLLHPCLQTRCLTLTRSQFAILKDGAIEIKAIALSYVNAARAHALALT